MTEIYTVDGGQKDALLRRANIKKNNLFYNGKQQKMLMRADS